jgi:hypothetical protein
MIALSRIEQRIEFEIKRTNPINSDIQETNWSTTLARDQDTMEEYTYSLERVASWEQMRWT